MSQWYEGVTPEIREFIAEQKMFFVATAPVEGRINLSPKGMDTFRVLSQDRVIYLDIAGSGNETAAHLLQNGRITIMFCSFSGSARIVRLYGRGRSIRAGDEKWTGYLAMFQPPPGVRQIMEIDVESAMTSCGYGVAKMDGLSERDTLRKYWEKRDQSELADFQRKENDRSIDGLPTGLSGQTTPGRAGAGNSKIQA